MHVDPSEPGRLYEERLRAAEAARLAKAVRPACRHPVRWRVGDVLIRAGMWLRGVGVWLRGGVSPVHHSH